LLDDRIAKLMRSYPANEKSRTWSLDWCADNLKTAQSRLETGHSPQ
jgi:hypothetical protein